EPKAAAESFLNAWAQNDPQAMYAMLSSASQAGVTAEDFSALYASFAQNLTLQKLEIQVADGQYDAQTAKIPFSASYETALFDTLTRQNELELVMENGAWKVAWNDGLLLPEMKGGNRLALDLTVPERAQIQDRNGETIAGTDSAVSLGIIPGNLGDNENAVLDKLYDLTGKVPQSIYDSYENAAPSWYIPVGEVSQDYLGNDGDWLANSGVVQYTYGPTRFYPWGGVAPHVSGYVQFIPKESLDRYLQNGYRRDEKVGMSGLEWWGQQTLAGTRGADLYLVNSSGDRISRLAQVAEQPGKNIITTLDMRLQLQSQQAIRDYRGAIVVMERDTGRILAMVSSPGFDPNMFDGENYNAITGGGLERIFSSSATPLVNRATGDQGSGYPLGSVFKIIDMAAALESGLFDLEQTYDCKYEFNEIIGRTYYDWTLAKDFPESGVLTLQQGLMRSCNPWFYHIGLRLYNEGHGTDIANMARGFGLGKVTGLDVLDEAAGNVPEPSSEVDAVEQAIGQGELQVTPLQVATFLAALGNGGTLYKPQLIEKYIGADGSEEQVFQPVENGKLPISAETLDAIRIAMRAVTFNKRGTAYDEFAGFGIPVYGKTGTAQSCEGCNPHAWFAAYTDNNNPDRPDIAVAVICEQAGEGSEIAAPITRRVMEVYFYGRALKVYPWEDRINVRATETPTPTPGEEATPTPEP
ncbi:MAG TPA: penicillin-binding transpeptidase domain-containing protein, partial [Anaerolineaceae bacterium]